METKSLEDLLDAFGESMTTEAQAQGLETWSIGASGENIADVLQGYSVDELEELREEILDGQKIQVMIDLSDSFLALLDELIENAEEEDEEDYDDSEEDDEDDYEDYD